MDKSFFDGEFFNVEDTLSCGQLFRFKPYKNGYLVFAEDKCAYAYNQGEKAVVECDKADKEFFEEYFDLKRDYSLIYLSAVKEGFDILSKSATLGKGVRILNQNKVEALISFIVSQNNNIPRIKGILERLCTALGEEKKFGDVVYNAFPTAESMAKMPVEFYKNIGLGYRAEYVKVTAELIANGMNLDDMAKLSTLELKKALVALKGVGPKVADCVLLFGFHRSDSFPVDTWIEKVYREDFGGALKDRNKITEWFTEKFKNNSGYYQQYLFYYKRSLEKLSFNNVNVKK